MADELPAGVNRIQPTTPAVEAPSPTGTAVLPQWLIRLAMFLVAVAGVVAGLPASGVSLPPLVTGIATGVVGVGAAMGIASQGYRR